MKPSFEDKSLFEHLVSMPDKIQSGVDTMFGKKKKAQEPQKEDMNVETTRADAELDAGSQQKQRKLTELEKQLLVKVQDYNLHYAGVFRPEQVASMAFIELEAHKLSLLFAVQSELVEMNKLLREMKESEQ